MSHRVGRLGVHPKGCWGKSPPSLTEGGEMSKEVKCLEASTGSCQGQVALRESLTGTGQPIARCDHHWHKRLDRQQAMTEAGYFDENPPSWFDPSYAGESW